MVKHAFDWCPHAEDHTPCPDGYIQWHAWAEKMSKTHRQEKCGECGRWSIWIPKTRLTPSHRTS
jgi:hypothetical protein